MQERAVLVFGGTIRSMNFEEEKRQGLKVRAYHEAGHAIANAYIEFPFTIVTVPTMFGGAGGVDFGTEYDYSKCEQELLIKLAKGTAAGLLATSRYDRLHPDTPLIHVQDEGMNDEEQLQNIGKCLDRTVATVEALKEQAADILGIPYVWAAVEDLARQLEKTQGKRGILEEQVREILQNAKNQA